MQHPLGLEETEARARKRSFGFVPAGSTSFFPRPLFFLFFFFLFLRSHEKPHYHTASPSPRLENIFVSMNSWSLYREPPQTRESLCY
ncbi:hypothetical protein SODALDRAFT_28428 [Sodiomyces alkalinus F11]|uniref:Uncharacterized protein n=1 Tax=Sodiomyces alkalinus (strain CBS 110278 / VKM F-3762 / F11) TaxID=1314773 RepID=A0A3N2Q8E1_SODAK|nr:hypothetical protein SODALDRAFT_28428 [Sodiomyces alkalinus F11]ROT43006.1 hypothetical protein SODALDRAFT_28428 [Sodiomyces alkalinus F11]